MVIDTSAFLAILCFLPGVEVPEVWIGSHVDAYRRGP